MLGIRLRQVTRFAMTGAIVALAGCQAAPHQDAMAPPGAAEEMVWVRTDGQRGAGDPALQRQYQIDVAACPGAAQRSPAATGCMRQRGYALAPISQAESLRQDFAARPSL